MANTSNDRGGGDQDRGDLQQDMSPDHLVPAEGSTEPAASTSTPGHTRREFLGLGTLGTVAAVTAPITAGISLILSDDELEEIEGREIEPPSTDSRTVIDWHRQGDIPEYEYITPIIRHEKFWDDTDLAGRTRKFVDTYKQIHSGDFSEFIYYGVSGEVLGRAKLPKNWPVKGAQKEWEYRSNLITWPSSERQKWHNDNRKQFADKSGVVLPDPNDSDEIVNKTGYPLVALSLPIGMQEEDAEGNTAVGIIGKRLDEKLQGDGYFDGEEISLRDAIMQIAEVYGVPVQIALGLGSQETGFFRGEEYASGHVQTITSLAKAKGIYQFLERTSNAYAKPHLKRTALRTRELGDFDSEINNRFAQAELFCAHYIYLKEQLQPSIEQLCARLHRIDLIESASPEMFEIFAVTTSYIAGIGRVKDAIDRFCNLGDEGIKEHIGKPPYGLDAILGVLAYSFAVDGIGKDTFQYGLKVIAWGELISGKDLLAKYQKNRSEAEDELAKLEFKQTLKVVAGTVIGSVSGIATAFTIAGVVADLFRRGSVSRRTFAKAGAGAIAAAMIVTRPGCITTDSTFSCAEPTEKTATEHKAWNELNLGHETYESVIQDTLPALDELYADMRARGSFDRTDKENTWRRDFLLPKQYDLLKDTFDEALGKDFTPRKWRNAVDTHNNWTDTEKSKGNLIEMKEDDPSLPYFCQQVGRPPGHVDNDKDSLMMRKEFLPIMGTLVELVNYQIDLFNANPSAYDYGAAFANTRIPHISAIKISGAYRNLEHHYQGVGSMGAKSKPSAHVVGCGLDIAALNRPEKRYKIVRFVEPFAINGKRQLNAGEKLPSAGFGEQTRVIISRMIGRALMAMEGSLEKNEGITLRALWETNPLNWHLTMKPASEDFESTITTPKPSTPEPTPEEAPSSEQIWSHLSEIADDSR